MGKKKILIIDDQKDLLFLLKTALTAKSAGGDYDVVTAQNGVEGMAKALSEKPDLIVSDIVMPGKDGTELGEALKENPVTRNIPIIFLSSLIKKDEELRGSAENSGYHIIAKPFEPEVLLRKIKHLLSC